MGIIVIEEGHPNGMDFVVSDQALRTKPRFMKLPVPSDVAPEVGMVFVLDYDHRYCQCEALTITAVDGDSVDYVMHLSGARYASMSWRRRFQRQRPAGYTDDQERA